MRNRIRLRWDISARTSCMNHIWLSLNLKNYAEKKTNTKTDILSIIAELLSIRGILTFSFIMNEPIDKHQKQPSRGVLRKRCCENMQQIYRRIPMPKCDLNKVASAIKVSQRKNGISPWKRIKECRKKALLKKVTVAAKENKK